MGGGAVRGPARGGSTGGTGAGGGHSGSQSCLFSSSCQAYPTTNIFYPYSVSMKIAMRKAMEGTDETYKATRHVMMDKFDKYWKERSNLIVIATFLDPRYMMKYVEWFLVQIYGKETGKIKMELVEEELKYCMRSLMPKCIITEV